MLYGLRAYSSSSIPRYARVKAWDLGLSVVVVDRTRRHLANGNRRLRTTRSVRSIHPVASGAARYRIATHTTAEFMKTLPTQLAQHGLSSQKYARFKVLISCSFVDRGFAM
jgi:hypothetical protein